MEAIRNMMQGNGNNGHDDMFRNDFNELEGPQVHLGRHRRSGARRNPGPADVYWMLGGCLHQLQRERGCHRTSASTTSARISGSTSVGRTTRWRFATTTKTEKRRRHDGAGGVRQSAERQVGKTGQGKAPAAPGRSEVRRQRCPALDRDCPNAGIARGTGTRNYHGDAEGRVMASSDNNGKPSSPLEEWNRQLDVVRTLIISAAKGYRNGLGLYGPPGVGKTHTVQEILKELKMKWAEAPKGLTPQGLLEFFEEFGSGIMIFDDVAELFQKERARKYMMAAFGTRPDYTQPRIVPYAREGRKMSVTVAGCCFVMTNEERFPAAFASRITTLEFAPTQQQVAALMRDIASRGVRRDKWELSASESTEVAEFLIPEARALGVRLDLRDLIEKSLPDYALWKDGLARVHWKDLVRAHFLGKLTELKHTPPKPTSRASRLDKEREVVREILREGLKSRAEQLEAWRAKFPDAGDRRFDRRKAEIRGDI